MKVAFHRGRLASIRMATASRAEAMMSVNLPEGSIQSYLEKVDCVTLNRNIHVACVNSPWNCTISGSEDTIDTIKCHLDADLIFAAKLDTGVAYHSPAMLEVSDEYAEALGSLSPAGLPDLREIPMISSITGKVVSPKALATAQYWVDNLVSPVRFSDAVLGLMNHMPPDIITDYLEVGPHSVLRRPLKDILKHHLPEQKQPRYHTVLQRSMAATQTMFKTLGALLCLGYPVDVTRANQLHTYGDHLNTKGQPTPILLGYPKYPFDHSQRYWKESRLSRGYRFRGQVLADTLGARVADWNPLEPRWRNLLSIESMPWIGDHVVGLTNSHSPFSCLSSPTPYGCLTDCRPLPKALLPLNKRM